MDPIDGSRSFHAGLDMAAPLGTPVQAVADGKVVYVGPGFAGRSSQVVIVEHAVAGRVFTSWYVHMYASGVYVGLGETVMAGQVIAGVGSNGRSTGPHLHLEIHDGVSGTDTGGVVGDPLGYLAGLDCG
ncbi:M23 family metallopeptidase [Pseudactinotalea sp. HY160]|uniref:M23 family metallopeptidase n=1 Tax=Pseudactinotalea sp. HY160 TaxID=2654490 RepID=UPI001883A59B|nr:M23 family metallopeptidase [Pseudactinotalea sp. HY160]